MNEILWVILLLVNFIGITLAHKFFGKTGLFVWVAIASILVNVQVLKIVDVFAMTIALGNITYGTSFLATDILNEYYGKEDARKAVKIGFFTLIATAIIMPICLLFIPNSADYISDSLAAVFGVMPRMAIASLGAYYVSQSCDVKMYAYIKKKFNRKWLSNNLSTMTSQLIDNVIFSILAFAGVFEVSVIVKLVFSTYLLKVVIAAADTPFLYFAARHVRDEKSV